MLIKKKMESQPREVLKWRVLHAQGLATSSSEGATFSSAVLRPSDVCAAWDCQALPTMPGAGTAQEAKPPHLICSEDFTLCHHSDLFFSPPETRF